MKSIKTNGLVALEDGFLALRRLDDNAVQIPARLLLGVVVANADRLKNSQVHRSHAKLVRLQQTTRQCSASADVRDRTYMYCLIPGWVGT